MRLYCGTGQMTTTRCTHARTWRAIDLSPHLSPKLSDVCFQKLAGRSQAMCAGGADAALLRDGAHDDDKMHACTHVESVHAWRACMQTHTQMRLYCGTGHMTAICCHELGLTQAMITRKVGRATVSLSVSLSLCLSVSLSLSP